MPLIRITHRTPPSSDNHRGKFSRELALRGNFARGGDTLRWIIFLSREINFSARATPDEYRIDKFLGVIYSSARLQGKLALLYTGAL